MRTIRTAANVALLLAALAATPAAMAEDSPGARDAMPVDLTGVWNLDAANSDDLAGELEALRESLLVRLEAQKPPEGQGGEDAPLVRKGKYADRGRVQAGAVDAPRELTAAMAQLLITVDGANVEIMDGTDVTKIWTPGGGPVQREGPGGQVLEQAWWEGDVLVLSTTGGPLVTTRRLQLEDDGKTLVAKVTVKVSGTAERIDARVVYTGY